MRRLLRIALSLVTLAGAALSCSAQDRVRLMRVPDGGIQPEVAVDSRGTVHLVYLKGDPAHSDVYYVRSSDWGATFSTPIRVNSVQGSAIAIGSIRGARLAVTKDGQVYVAWNGSRPDSGGVTPAAGGSDAFDHMPMLFAKLNASGTAFEPERNLMRLTYGLDGGGSVAAGGHGDVYVAWHGNRRGLALDEGHRRVWVARSRDQGAGFALEHAVNVQSTGACGCCALGIFVDRQGTIYVLYRTATGTVHRDIHLLVSRDRGRTFEDRLLDKWTIGACPMTSVAFAQAGHSVRVAWQTKSQVYFASVPDGTLDASKPIAAPGSGKLRKYPALAVNSTGDTLLEWTDGTGWGARGSLAWRVFDRQGRPLGETGRVPAPGLPAWSFGAAFAKPDGGFVVLY
ncbi:MAG TPA: sialidase family protein [Terriglobia bacterium]|nr:sialidase family protein [Terriglobia bacterium]